MLEAKAAQVKEQDGIVQIAGGDSVGRERLLLTGRRRLSTPVAHLLFGLERHQPAAAPGGLPLGDLLELQVRVAGLVEFGIEEVVPVGRGVVFTNGEGEDRGRSER